ncbi:AraC family transcriptional regulator [uncultured Subdoligranulum sp.]|uniref:AraC family transcriptional regulator n=1 Tax=uncultured Subdoligranulum sp. TaxID=512298 RepID=UPI00261756C9|nr:AraC family transcriptional regulator [uncultured Subdoligranulum sp.]
MAGSHYNPYTRRQTMIASDYEIYRYRSTYMNEVELHHHDFYEVYLLLRGRVEYIVENHIYRMRPGDWMLTSPLELHQARIVTDADAYERFVLWIARPYLDRLSTPRTSLTRCFDTSVANHTNLLRLPGAAGAQMRASIERLCSLRTSKEYGSDLLAQGALVELMIGLNRAAEERGDARPAGTSDQVVDAVLHYINEHYSETLTLDQLAEKFFISKYHLLRKFDAQVGTTVHRYILQKRLLNAKQLLAGGVPPNEVCQYCGFGDYANFYRAFKAEYNQTPRQYIQAVRGA